MTVKDFTLSQEAQSLLKEKAIEFTNQYFEILEKEIREDKNPDFVEHLKSCEFMPWLKEFILYDKYEIATLINLDKEKYGYGEYEDKLKNIIKKPLLTYIANEYISLIEAHIKEEQSDAEYIEKCLINSANKEGYYNGEGNNGVPIDETFENEIDRLDGIVEYAQDLIQYNKTIKKFQDMIRWIEKFKNDLWYVMLLLKWQELFCYNEIRGDCNGLIYIY